MKRLLLILCFASANVQAAITNECSHHEGFAANGGTSSAVDTTGCNLLIVSVSSFQAPTLSDNQTNTWTELTSYGAGGVLGVRIFYCLNPTTNASHTFTISGTNSYPAIAVVGFSGVDSYDSKVSGNYSAASSTVQPGALTPSADGALLYTAAAFSATGTESINSGYTLDGQTNYSAGNYIGHAAGYLVQGTAASINPTWTHTGTPNHAATMAVFLPSAGGSSNPNPITPTIPGGTPDPLKRGPIP